MALHDLTARAAAAAIRARELSAVELVAHVLDRIDRLSPTVGAFVHVDAEAALAGARAIDDAVVRVSEGVDRLPPLLGVPIGVKDVTAVAGLPTSYGTRALDPDGHDGDDHVVALLRAAGCVIVGKTATPEFGLSAYTDPEGFPPARTPWDLDRTAGGSSGGSAAAVASGLVPVAHGSDGAGSVRTPASACGVVGLKPSRGRVSVGPRGGDGSGLGVHGILARTVADAAAMLDAMSGPMPGDSVWLPAPAQRFLDAVDQPPRRLRIGRTDAPLLADVRLDDDVTAAYEGMSTLLIELGHDVVDVEPPFAASRDAVVADFETVWSVGATAIPVPAERETMLRPLTRWLRERGRTVAGADYAAALRRLQLAAREALVATAAYDAVLLPTLATLPPALDVLGDDAHPAADFDAQKRFNPYSAAYNLTGAPAISLPVHWTDGGLPVGCQLVGPPAGEWPLLALAAAVETARPWADRTPGLWVG